ncbi:hypothetical protein BaRGS_00007939 [Batillaria attramentaria]|uniref:Uncharacterized protein n=1 Tax=Batillaria attramentaria TaxID=370345 RepID=A0ABD0LMP2_9CAEN
MIYGQFSYCLVRLFSSPYYQSHFISFTDRSGYRLPDSLRMARTGCKALAQQGHTSGRGLFQVPVNKTLEMEDQTIAGPTIGVLVLIFTKLLPTGVVEPGCFGLRACAVTGGFVHVLPGACLRLAVTRVEIIMMMKMCLDR